MVTKPAISELEETLTTAFSERRSPLRAITSRVDPNDAEDLLQDAALRAIETERRTPVQKPLHLLRRILRNLAVDHLRGRARTTRLFHPAEAPDVACERVGPERQLVASERLHRAFAIIDSMPHRRREVFLLHRIDELTQLQIARRLGISTKTVEKHVSLAMVQLSREIDRE